MSGQNLRISAHLGHLWQEMPLLDRVGLAADAGFDGVDIPFPYDLPAKELQRALRAFGIMLVSVATPPPNYTGGARGFAASPEGEARFKYDLRRAMRFADALGVSFVQVLTGPAVDEPMAATQSRLLANLQWAVQQPGKARLLLAAGCDTALPDPVHAAALVQQLNNPRLRLLIDTCETMAWPDAPAGVIASQLPVAGMIAISEGPPRARPDPRKTDFAAMLSGGGFQGWVSAAYPQLAKDPKVLDWATGLRQQH